MEIINKFILECRATNVLLCDMYQGICIESTETSVNYSTWKDNIANGLFVNRSKDSSVIYRGYYVDGQLHGEQTKHVGCLPYKISNYSHGVEHGLQMDWSYGFLSEMSIYNSGKRDGIHVKYYRNGNKELEIMYKNGQYHGPYKTWHLTGVLEESCEYVNGLRHGEALTWRGDGSLGAMTNYHYGAKCGRHTRFDTNGNVVWTKVYLPEPATVSCDWNKCCIVG